MNVNTMMGDKLLKLPEVCELVGLKRPTIYKYIKTEGFPKPIKIGSRASRWSYAQIMEWIEKQKNGRKENK